MSLFLSFSYYHSLSDITIPGWFGYEMRLNGDTITGSAARREETRRFEHMLDRCGVVRDETRRLLWLRDEQRSWFRACTRLVPFPHATRPSILALMMTIRVPKLSEIYHYSLSDVII